MHMQCTAVPALARAEEPHLQFRSSMDMQLTGSRGSKFLRSWMEFLEEHADLRYPDVSDVLQGE